MGDCASKRVGSIAVLLFVSIAAAGASTTATGQELEAEAAERFAALALECVHKEYPNKIAHVLNSDTDVKPPRELTPAFYGCYDWHSSVHGHWLLARLARTYPEASFTVAAREALSRSLTIWNIQIEVSYLRGDGRVSFERPYGLAWLLQLAAELREWQDPQAEEWSRALAPLEEEAALRIKEWLPKLTYAIRVGEHSQSAFAFGLIYDWSVIAEDFEMEGLLASRIADLYAGDRGCPIEYEPSGQDFLSPCLAEADLVRRLLEPEEFAGWLQGFLPYIPANGDASWLEPAIVSDPSDPKLAHLDGLNLSRAWMLEGIAAGLPSDDPRVEAISRAAELHRRVGLEAVTGEHYEGGHWLGSFAVYLVTRRGLS